MIKARPLPTIACALVLLTMSAIAQNSEAPAPDYFPLRVGNSWTYGSTSGDTQYSVKVITEEKQADGTIRYLAEKLAGAKVLTLFFKTSDWVLMHSEGYPEHEGLAVKYEPSRPYLKNPLTAGAKWEWQGKDYTQADVDEDNQVHGPEDVVVPAGKFRATKVVTKVTLPTSLTRISWYADGVGLVKSTTDAGQIKYGWELKDYSFKKK